MTFRLRAALATSLLLPVLAVADVLPPTEVPDGPLWAWHADADLIGQRHGAFASAWELDPAQGGDSFVSHPERSSSFLVGASEGIRLGEDGELWLREEGIRGQPLSAAGGLAGLTNNDMQRQATSRMKFYRALTFVRWGWSLGGEPLAIEDDSTQFARASTTRRLTLVAGDLDLLATFDANEYSHKGADQFLNWCFMTYCAYDFAADSRGYAWGAAADLRWDDGSVRLGRYTMPRLPNQLELDFHIGSHYSDNLEIERRWMGGSLKALFFHNVMPLSTYAGPVNIAPISTSYSGPNARIDRSKVGAGLDLQQDLGQGVGLFVRAMKARGNGETANFTEADRSIAFGILLPGSIWGRAADHAGVGHARQYASADRVHYLAQGLLGIFTGDGPPPPGTEFHYGAENVVEAYWQVGLGAGAAFTLDWQRIANPAYNRDRGPIGVWGVRLHWER
jgi:high affinity Mn2+ porin